MIRTLLVWALIIAGIVCLVTGAIFWVRFLIRISRK
jgi:hypothetical protein